jgi:bleomycin hydrolase
MTISLTFQKLFIVKKSILFSFVVLAATFTASAQQFTVVKDNAHGNVENQCKTGTCWSFATTSFIESEIIRKGNKPVDLSEMYNVRLTYPKKAESYVRFQGKQQFGPGGLSHDVISIIEEYGIVPEEAYSGFVGGTNTYDHGTLDKKLTELVYEAVTSPTNGYQDGIAEVLDNEIGAVPGKFNYNGASFTPASFRDAMKINAKEYVCLTSFSHHPFYSSFVLEVPDNWAKKTYYNIPLDDFQRVADFALSNGFTIAWDADVSEKTFDAKKGFAFVDSFQNEPKIDQAKRQAAFDSFETTDDHLMHITGTGKDEKGNAYYLVKNSWGTEGLANGGFQYISVPYFRYKTVCMIVHKDAIPKEIAMKLGM